MGAKGKPPETPIKGFIPRVKNIVIQHFRGILGVLVPILLLSWQLNLKTASVTAVHIWILMFCFFLFQPVSIQVTGMIPIFAFPMMGLYPTVQVVKMYFNEGVALFIIAGMLHLLLNNSGFDRRIILAILCAGKAKSGFTPIKLLCKCSCAGFLMSMFCHRLIVASTLIQYITPILMEAQVKNINKKKGKAAEFTKLRYVINNSIQISCALGGIVIVHASYCTLAYRAIFYGSVKDVQWPELLNYLRYTAFALPLALIIFVLNLIYHIILLKIRAKPVPEYKMTLFRTNLIKYKSQIPSKITNHEKLTIIFEILALAMLFGRYIDINSGAGWNKVNPNWSSANDATVAAIFVVMLHVLPRSCTFVKKKVNFLLQSPSQQYCSGDLLIKTQIMAISL
ncbi:protein I'm not dead yet [Amyelois transitella]|uniref:protein I'm not dead yet n=1 Tax=Amyelois transitella TaxID=680683 RepID=UPI00298F9727|nr:protein I'm not dead yet [Amyelois transitella]